MNQIIFARVGRCEKDSLIKELSTRFCIYAMIEKLYDSIDLNLLRPGRSVFDSKI
jgi:hypothetical protein